MKTNITVTVDVAVLAAAREKLNRNKYRISNFVEDALKQYSNIKDEEATNLEDAKVRLAGKIAEVAELKKRIDNIDNKDKDSKIIQVIE